MKRQVVFVGMSGGVDSSVAAALLQERGFNVVGVHLKCFNVDGCGERDAEDARRVAEQLGIPFYVFDLEDEYKKRVVEYMVDGYRQGLTPNPDVMCNKEIKFGLFLERALALGADYIATGHYVRLRMSPNRYSYAHQNSFAPAAKLSSPSAGLVAYSDTKPNQPAGCALRNSGSATSTFSLFEAKDGNKDQSYFLWTLTQKQLKHCLFPIGEYTKPQVRRLAKKFGLLTAEKKDSQGICFLGKVTLANFLKDYIPEKEGVVLNAAGQTIGAHRGAHFYTIGQRHGFRYQIRNKELGIKNDGINPHYISEKNIKDNTITVAEGEHNELLYQKEIFLKNVHFINPYILNPISSILVFVRVRYRQPLAKATLYQLSAKSYKLIFDQPQKFVAAGQSAVFYTKTGEMLGGGVIVGA